MPKKAYTTIGKACKALGIAGDFRPVTRIRDIFQGLKLDEIISCLRTSTDEKAMIICALFDRLSQPLQQAIDIDYLIAAAQCRDPHQIAGMICENYSRVKSLEANFVAAREAPGIMKDVAQRAKRRNGFQHARMALQIANIAPVPKNQVTIHATRIGKIDNSKNLTQYNGVPTHQGIVTEVGDILRQLPNAPSNSDSAEDSGHRAG